MSFSRIGRHMSETFLWQFIPSLSSERSNATILDSISQPRYPQPPLKARVASDFQSPISDKTAIQKYKLRFLGEKFLMPSLETIVDNVLASRIFGETTLPKQELLPLASKIENSELSYKELRNLVLQKFPYLEPLQTQRLTHLLASSAKARIIEVGLQSRL